MTLFLALAFVFVLVEMVGTLVAVRALFAHRSIKAGVVLLVVGLLGVVLSLVAALLTSAPASMPMLPR